MRLSSILFLCFLVLPLAGGAKSSGAQTMENDVQMNDAARACETGHFEGGDYVCDGKANPQTLQTVDEKKKEAAKKTNDRKDAPGPIYNTGCETIEEKGKDLERQASNADAIQKATEMLDLSYDEIVGTPDEVAYLQNMLAEKLGKMAGESPTDYADMLVDTLKESGGGDYDVDSGCDEYNKPASGSGGNTKPGNSSGSSGGGGGAGSGASGSSGSGGAGALGAISDILGGGGGGGGSPQSFLKGLADKTGMTNSFRDPAINPNGSFDNSPTVPPGSQAGGEMPQDTSGGLCIYNAHGAQYNGDPQGLYNNKQLMSEMFQSHNGDKTNNVPLELLNVLSAIKTSVENCHPEKKICLQLISGYRSPRYNASVSGAKKSQHLHGNAADIHVDGIKDEELRNTAWCTQGANGVGWYGEGNAAGIHVDVRSGGKTSWGWKPNITCSQYNCPAPSDQGAQSTAPAQ